MKKFIIASATVLTFISASAFTGPREGTNPAEATFRNEFKGVQDVHWTQGKDVITASFVISGTRAVAYFNTAGELLGTARNILFNQLPLAVVTEVNKRFGSASVYDITEYTTGADTFYTMSVDQSNKEVKLRSTSSGDITVESKVKK